jgi:cysteine-rich repeat protein
MTNTSSKLPVRVRAFLQLTGAALFMIAVVPGCGSSDNKSGSPGGGGSAGTSGNESGGNAGSMSAANAGTTSAGSANAGSANGGSAGGSGVTTGDAGSPEAGATGTPTAACGNGKLDPGEECDDGNLQDEDGCSSLCTNKCEQCEAAANCFTQYDLSQPCKTPADCQNRENEASSFELCYGATGDGQAPASAGPAAGTLKSKLCQAVIACIRRTQCITDLSDASPTACYCGAGNDLVACETAPKGPCAEEIADAAEARSFQAVQQAWGSLDTTAPGAAVGAAANILFNCDASACASQCFQDKTPTACDQCAIGSNAHDQHLLCPDYDTCYFGQETVSPDGYGTTALPVAQLCSAAADCALRTGCGANGAEACYGNGAGPCATEFAAAAGSTDPLTVVSRIQNAIQSSSVYPANTAQSLLACEAAHCASSCFPSVGGSGGSAGTGGASAGTAGTNAGTGGASAGTGGTSAGTGGSSGA